MPNPRPLRPRSPADAHHDGRKTARRQRVRHTSFGITSPAELSGLVVWWDFSSAAHLFTDTGLTTNVVNDGDAIAGVLDRSGNANNVTQGTSGNRPAYKTGIQNGLSIGRGTDAANTFMNATNTAVTTDSTVIAVVKSAGAVSNKGTVLFSQRKAGGNGIRCDVTTFDNGASGITARCAFRNDAAQLVSSAGTTDIADTFSIVSATFEGTTQTLYTNTTQEDQDTNDGGATDSDTIYCFDADGSFINNCDIAEVIVYSRALSSGDLASIWSYLETKWGL